MSLTDFERKVNEFPIIFTVLGIVWDDVLQSLEHAYIRLWFLNA